MKLRFGRMHTFVCLYDILFDFILCRLRRCRHLRCCCCLFRRNFCCAFLHSEYESNSSNSSWNQVMWKATCISFVECTYRQADRVQQHLNAIKINFMSLLNMIPSNFNLQWSRFFSFVLFLILSCVSFSRLLACCFYFSCVIILGSLHQLTALWLSSMNNAINCDFENNSNNNCSTSSNRKWNWCAKRERTKTNRNYFVAHFHMTLWRDPILWMCQCIVHIKIPIHPKRVMWLLSFDRDV